MPQPDPVDDVSAVVKATLEAAAPTITLMLEHIAKRFDAFGCGLWEVSPGADLDDPEHPKGYLLTVAAWWRNEELFAMNDVPLHDSAASRVALTQKPLSEPNIQENGGAQRNRPFWKRNKVFPMCAAPVTFMSDDKGVINLYRSRNPDFGSPDPFSGEEQRRLCEIAKIIPGLYRAVRERIGLNLVKDVEELLRKAEEGANGKKRTPTKPLSDVNVKKVLNKVCERVNQAFDCVETSLFLESPDALPDTRFECVATTNQKAFSKRIYLLPEDEGSLTGWVLTNWSSLAVQDLAKFNEQFDQIEKRYPGVETRDVKQDTDKARKLLGLAKNADVPPLSFMAVPVFGGQAWWGGTDLNGALRCHMAKSGPFYFADKETDLLESIATQVGQWWSRWRSRTQMADENRIWEKLNSSLSQLNDVVRQELRKDQPQEEVILTKALDLTSKVFPGAGLNGVRMANRERSSLIFSAFTTQAKALLGGRKPPPIPISKMSSDRGVKVFLSGKPHQALDVKEEKGYVPLFEETRGKVTVAISAGDENYGVLDLRWQDGSISRNAMAAATVLGQQLGLYHQLLLLVEEQRAAAKEAKRQSVIQGRAYEDFSHQLKSPLNLTVTRAELELQTFPVDSPERYRWQVIRGLARRAQRVANSMKLFVDLSNGKPPTPSKVSFEPGALRKKLFELAADSQLFASQRTGVSIWVEESTITGLLASSLNVDSDLLEQMLANLLDNAVKYSRPKSRVRILGGITGGGRPYLAVANQGLPFPPHELAVAKQRGWRSPYAMRLGAEGQGIGLWVVDQLMLAHGGSLDVISPNANHEIEMRLHFPAPPQHR